jgi:benzil reductase ((S)-benzoin forming)
MPDTIVWVTGATEGLGLGIARTVPWQNARVINLSNLPHSEFEFQRLDLRDPESWREAAEHLEQELAAFSGKTAIFIHNAYHQIGAGFAGEVHPDAQVINVIANVAAPLVLADAFVRACKPELDAGLVMISSNVVDVPLEGLSVYCAAKAAIEQWVRVVRLERLRRGSGPWVIAVRPGMVDTPSVRASARMAAWQLPSASILRKGLKNGDAMDPETVGRRIWAALPPASDTEVIDLLTENATLHDTMPMTSLRS